MLAATDGVRGLVDGPRHYQRGRPAGVDWDVETGAAAIDPGVEGDQLLEFHDPRINSGEAEEHWRSMSARHRDKPDDEDEPGYISTPWSRRCGLG